MDTVSTHLVNDWAISGQGAVAEHNVIGPVGAGAAKLSHLRDMHTAKLLRMK